MVVTASPQKEHGHTPIAHELMEALAATSLNGTQYRLLLVILRKTYGWNKKIDTIGLAQFCEATGLRKKLISRELNRLARRGIITVWGDDHHAKQYAIQKDYTRWHDDEPGDVAHLRALPPRPLVPAPPRSVPQTVDTSSVAHPQLSPDQGTPCPEVSTVWGIPDDEVSTKQRIPCAEVSPETAQSVPQTVDKVSPVWGTTKETKTSKGLTDSHESGAHAPPGPVGTLRDRYDARYREATNKVAVLGEAFRECLGSKPDHGRLGALMRDAGGGAKLLDLILEASRQRIGDDPHDYLAAMVRRERSGGGGRGYVSQADMNSGSRRRFVGA